MQSHSGAFVLCRTHERRRGVVPNAWSDALTSGCSQNHSGHQNKGRASAHNRWSAAQIKWIRFQIACSRDQFTLGRRVHNIMSASVYMCTALVLRCTARHRDHARENYYWLCKRVISARTHTPSLTHKQSQFAFHIATSLCNYPVFGCQCRAKTFKVAVTRLVSDSTRRSLLAVLKYTQEYF